MLEFNIHVWHMVLSDQHILDLTWMLFHTSIYIHMEFGCLIVDEWKLFSGFCCPLNVLFRRPSVAGVALLWFAVDHDADHGSAMRMLYAQNGKWLVKKACLQQTFGCSSVEFWTVLIKRYQVIMGSVFVCQDEFFFLTVEHKYKVTWPKM